MYKMIPKINLLNKNKYSDDPASNQACTSKATSVGDYKFEDEVYNLKVTPPPKSISKNKIKNSIKNKISIKKNNKHKNIIKFKIKKNIIQLGTLNTRTLKKAGKIHQLFTGANKVDIDFLAVQETKIKT